MNADETLVSEPAGPSRQVLDPTTMPPDDADAFARGKPIRSLVIIRFAAGLVGVVLPLVLLGVDYFFLGQNCIRVRESLSAYYHSGARDIFVVGLGIVGFLLAAYKITRATIGNVLSLVAGLAIIGVATLPTRLPKPIPGNECGGGVEVLPETPLQNYFGEEAVATLHGRLAGIAFLAFAAICIYTAWRDRRYPMQRRAEVADDTQWRWLKKSLAWITNRIPWWVHLILGLFILVICAAYCIATGSGLEQLPMGFGPTWVVEFMGIWLFSLSWFAKGLDDYFERREPPPNGSTVAVGPLVPETAGAA